jgi:hypothetical protein
MSIAVDFSALDRQRRIDRLRAECKTSGETEDEAAVRGLKRLARQMEQARLRGVFTPTRPKATKEAP